MSQDVGRLAEQCQKLVDETVNGRFAIGDFAEKLRNLGVSRRVREGIMSSNWNRGFFYKRRMVRDENWNLRMMNQSPSARRVLHN